MLIIIDRPFAGKGVTIKELDCKKIIDSVFEAFEMSLISERINYRFQHIIHLLTEIDKKATILKLSSECGLFESSLALIHDIVDLLLNYLGIAYNFALTALKQERYPVIFYASDAYVNIKSLTKVFPAQACERRQPLTLRCQDRGSTDSASDDDDNN